MENSASPISKELVLDFRYLGLLYASTVLSLWLGSLFCFLFVFEPNSLLVSCVGLLLITFLYVGLFITAHDAMHGVVAPQNRKINDLIGRLAVILYALFDYSKLVEEHQKHHSMPASEHDPDFHDGEHSGFFSWYMRFLSHYISWKQLLGMAIVFNILHHLGGVPLINLYIFWVAPAVLSTLQLFYFGTYLPHQEPAEGYTNSHRAKSNNYSVLWSFLTCYHFGYHLEHHEYPYAPWWRLPFVRRTIESSRNL